MEAKEGPLGHPTLSKPDPTRQAPQPTASGNGQTEGGRQPTVLAVCVTLRLKERQDQEMGPLGQVEEDFCNQAVFVLSR